MTSALLVIHPPACRANLILSLRKRFVDERISHSARDDPAAWPKQNNLRTNPLLRPGSKTRHGSFLFFFCKQTRIWGRESIDFPGGPDCSHRRTRRTDGSGRGRVIRRVSRRDNTHTTYHAHPTCRHTVRRETTTTTTTACCVSRQRYSESKNTTTGAVQNDTACTARRVA